MRFTFRCLALIALVAASLPAMASVIESVTDTFWVAGMALPDCDDVGLALLLESLPGVESADVTFESGLTHVRYDPAAVSRGVIIAEVVNRGFRVPWVADAFVVSGWQIASRDALAVRLLVGSLDGVDGVELDEDSGRAVVRYDPQKVSTADVITEVTNLGYDIVPVANNAGGHDLDRR